LRHARPRFYAANAPSAIGFWTGFRDLTYASPSADIAYARYGEPLGGQTPQRFVAGVIAQGRILRGERGA